MRIFGYSKSMASIVFTILVVFIGTSLFDVVLSVVSMRFYSTAAFIAIFGVGGVFAGLGAYQAGIEEAPQKNEVAKWVVIAAIISIGMLFLFLLSKLEGGEYEIPFKAFGITTALAGLLAMKGG